MFNLGIAKFSEEFPVKMNLVSAGFALAAALLVSPTPAPAAGRLRGAIIGGIAGHYAGHHGLLGTGAGCVVGRHEANRRARERAEQARSNDRADQQGYGSSAQPFKKEYNPR